MPKPEAMPYILTTNTFSLFMNMYKKKLKLFQGRKALLCDLRAGTGYRAVNNSADFTFSLSSNPGTQGNMTESDFKNYETFADAIQREFSTANLQNMFNSFCVLINMEEYSSYYLITSNAEVKFIFDYIEKPCFYAIRLNYSDVIPRLIKRVKKGSKNKTTAALQDLECYWEKKKKCGLIESEKQQKEAYHSKWVNKDNLDYETISFKTNQKRTAITKEENPTNENSTASKATTDSKLRTETVQIEVFSEYASILKALNSILYYLNVIKPGFQHTNPVTEQEVIDAISSLRGDSNPNK